ncbi:phage minor tail protein L [Castellaniella sp.]|uniref:phage minor tail protein L n=1 Tax=Castellaniella sp. TaxID=1955812 RepID=UPI002AFE0244|nr:phage minor tail protein L [Castellaniella sp.]
MSSVIPREVAIEIQSLSPSAIIQLFVLDSTALGGDILYFHAGTNFVQAPLVWQGQTYAHLPIDVDGFDIATQGSAPRPKIRIANADGMFSKDVRDMDDLVGAKVIRKRTFARFLDAVNFPDGVNPTANPAHCFEDDMFFVNRKISENQLVIEWELASAFDVEGVQLPFRQIIQNSCPWIYRGAECGYTGTTYFNAEDQRVYNASEDVCGKRLTSCSRRFGQNSVLPFGGFPGATRYE